MAKFTVARLKEELGKRGLERTGLKQVLVARLVEALASDGTVQPSGGAVQPASRQPGPKAKRPREEQPALTWQPEGWRSTYALIKELRADRTAVVDSMGTEALSEEGATAEEREYHALVSTT